MALSLLMFSRSASPAAAGGTAPAVRMITVAPGVTLEVLDWGGPGRPIVFLGGYGRTAHDFEGIGPKLSVTNRTIAITRRGFGASTRATQGYTSDRLGDDVMAVLDSLHLRSAVVAGHSLGGEELSSIGTRHAEQVGGLVYLDAAYGYAFYDEADYENRRFVDRNEVVNGLRDLTSAIYAGRAERAHALLNRLIATDLPALKGTLEHLSATLPKQSPEPARPLGMRLRPGVDQMVFEGLQRYTSVNVPILAIYALKNTTDQEVLADWRMGRRHELIALRKAAPQARVVIIEEASHDVFKSNEADVVREILSFVSTLSRGR